MSVSIPQKTTPSSSNHYVDVQMGWRLFFIAIAVAGIFGLSFRLYFSPERVKKWITTALSQKHSPIEVRFQKAELRLSRGAIPQFAILLTGVQAAPTFECLVDAPLKISELRLPFRLRSLSIGQVALGTVTADNMVIDLDGLKNCGQTSVTLPPQPQPPTGAKRIPAQIPVNPAGASESVATPLKQNPTRPWWTHEQLSLVQRLLDGFEFTQTEVLFEGKTKKIYLESFAMSTADGEDTVALSADLRVPPEVTYGETVPPLSIDGIVKAASAEVEVSAHVSEGTLKGLATLVPAVNGGLEIDARVAIQDAPLSTLVPLLTKAGITSQNFKPKFIWLDCQAAIKGPFQKLFRERPLRVENCLLKGSGGQIHLASAVRQPTGVWDPFAVKLVSVDLKRLVETFSVRGPDGVANDFGRLSGQIEVKTPKDASFKGFIEGAQIRFSKRSVRALQRVERLEAQASLRDNKLQGTIDKVILERGEFDGSLGFEFDREFRNGKIQAQIKSLSLDDQVQQLLVGGDVSALSGSGEARLADGRLAFLKSEFHLPSLHGREFQLSDASFRTELTGNDLHVILQAPRIDLRRTSAFFQAGHPIFFGHEFAAGEWVPISDAMIRAHFPDAGGLEWEKAQGKMEGGRIQMVSTGGFSRDRHLRGWVSVDFPAVKKLQWALAGTLDAPIFNDDSQTLAELRRKLEINDKVLGLPLQPVLEEIAQPESITLKTTRGLRELGTKVMQKARGIVPAKARKEDPASSGESASQ